MSSGIFFCKRPNSICLLAGTKTIRQSRESGFLVSLEKGQRQSSRRRRRWMEGGQWGDTDNWVPPPPPAVGGWFWWLWTGMRLSTRPPLSGLSAGRDTERKCHSRRACWVNLDSAESCCSSLHNKSNTITPAPPLPKLGHTHTQLNLCYCLEECVRKTRLLNVLHLNIGFCLSRVWTNGALIFVSLWNSPRAVDVRVDWGGGWWELSSVLHPPLAIALSTGLFPLTMRGDSEQWNSSVWITQSCLVRPSGGARHTHTHSRTYWRTHRGSRAQR